MMIIKMATAHYTSGKGEPLRIQIAEQIKQRIARSYDPGEVLPTHRQMASEYQVSLRTIAQAVDLLASQGIVTPIRRRGTVVNRRLRLGERQLAQVGLAVSVAPGNLTYLQYLNEIVTSFLAELDHLGADVRILARGSANQPDIVARAGIDALALLTVAQRTPIVELAQLDLPMVVMDYQRPDLPLDYVVCDNLRAAAAIVEHLARLHHIRIAYVGHAPPLSEDPDAPFLQLVEDPDVRERREGFLAAVAQLGLAFCGPARQMSIHEHEASPDLEDLLRILRLPQPPTAIVADDATTASRLIRSLVAAGIRVPQDVSVAAIALPGSEPAVADLTGCHMDFTEMGRRAANLLEIRSRLPRPSEANIVRVGFALVPGQTVRPLD